MAILSDLRAMTLESVRETPALAAPEPAFHPEDGLNRAEATSIALTWNPELRAFRAEAGVAAAQLVEAGLFPDPALGWDAVDWLVGRTGDDALTGFSIRFPLPAPGVIPAREGIARGRVEEVHWLILGREWLLKRRVDLAFLGVLAAQARLALNGRLQEIARKTHDFFARGRAVGAATALQENLARLDLAQVERDGRRLELEVRRARQNLNSLLGLPPETEFELQTPKDPFAVSASLPSASEVTALAVKFRPDLKELLAVYHQSEENLRLQIARQWPLFALGTGLDLILPVFSRFNQPAIRTAREARERIAREVEAEIHRLRAEVFQAVVQQEIALDQVNFFRQEIEPQLEESLRLSEEALRQGEATLVEILTAQSQVLNARQQFLEARIENARARTVVAWVSGQNSTSQQP
ncbi:MAG: TolC family protein [Planctomycetota bacterium]